jgi:asparagine synthase (glutamine-hydrolysing)
MCGILGVLADASQRGERLASVELMRHRGPDSAGYWEDGQVALAIRRLAIIDVDGGDQPIFDESGLIVVVANCEIYNYRELRRGLIARGHSLRTAGDVEVIAHLYEEHGDACFEHLRGMFAVALWDARRQRLVLARDRFGIKPLYVADTPRGLAFASEIAPLLALGTSAAPSLQALADYLTLGYAPGVQTALAGVRRVEPATVMTFENGSKSSRVYWRLEPPEGEQRPLADVLAEAVALHLRSDVSLALLLSGGLDSSLIASFAADELDEPLRTFSVGFGDAAYDELHAARAVAVAIGSRHEEVAVHPNAAHDLPRIVERLEEPLADPSAIPLWYVCREVGAEVKVALAGDGGDEIFGGYSRYAWDAVAARVGLALPTTALARVLERLPGLARRSGRKDLGRRALKLLRHASLPDAERYLSWFALFSDDAKRELVGDGWQPAARIFGAHLAAAPPRLTRLGRLQNVDLNTMLLDDLLLKGDKMSMAHSLELRVPLLDHEIVRAGLYLPDEEKLQRLQTKRVLRELARRRLPAGIADRPKQGFDVPLTRWLREDLGELAHDVLAREQVRRRGLLDADAVARLMREHRKGQADHASKLYALLVLELWLAQIERPSVAPVSATTPR